MKRKVLFLLAISITGFLSWYFLVRKSEFNISFKLKTHPGDIVQGLRIWDRSKDDLQILEVDSVFSVLQSVKLAEHEYQFVWKLDQITDEESAVKLEISEPGHSFMNKVQIPFLDTELEQNGESLAREFYEIMLEHLKITGVKLVGESEFETRYCACADLTTKQIDKAVGMMQIYNALISVIEENALEVNGKPIVSVTAWNHSQGNLSYRFCFPVKKPEVLPTSDWVYFHEFESMKTLKAEYNGNYITSDRAWYYLYDAARNQGLKPIGLPVEVFYNNPNMGVNESGWKAEIFLPVE